MHSQNTSASEYDEYGNWRPCGPGCACNSLTLICWGPRDVESAELPACAFCGHPGATDTYREEDYSDAPCCADEHACYRRVVES